MYISKSLFFLVAAISLPFSVFANHNSSDSHEYYRPSTSGPTLTISTESNHTYTSHSSNGSVTVQSSHSHHRHNSHGHHSVEADLLYIFLEIFDDSFFYGGIASMERAEGRDGLGLTPRVEGELLIPFFKFDASALSSMEPNQMGSDMSFEMGYGPWALAYRNTQFITDDFYTSINSFNKFEFLYRMSYGSEFEIDFGMGSYQVNDELQFSLSLPMKLAFTPHNVLEFRPTWSQDVSDYDVALYSGTEFYSFKVGYRYVQQRELFSTTPLQTYSNIYAGFSAHY